MKKTIIAVYGSTESGKTRTIKHFAFGHNNDLIGREGNIVTVDPNNSNDIFGTIQQGTSLIGISSQGDPGTGLLGRLQELVDRNCDIIICATRTKGQTVWDVDNIASSNQYNVIWFANFIGNGNIYNQQMLNHISGNAITNVVNGLINGTI